MQQWRKDSLDGMNILKLGYELEDTRHELTLFNEGLQDVAACEDELKHYKKQAENCMNEINYIEKVLNRLEVIV